MSASLMSAADPLAPTAGVSRHAPPARPARVLAVVGMHRSGTSCLTGSLQEAGLFLGDCQTWNPFNEKGNRENLAFVDLHEAILEANDGAWDRPPRRALWQPEHTRRAAELLAEHADAPVLGFKDPRALLLIGGWQALVPELELVGIFRHPEAVALSLKRRSNLERAHALELWYHYNRALLRLRRQRAFPLLCFDEPDAVFQSKVVLAARQLGLPREPAASEFFDSQLKQYGGDTLSDLPWRVRRLYKQLQRLSL
ncbi:MAG: sulfotransferase family protein [Anaerolineae bacterium]